MGLEPMNLLIGIQLLYQLSYTSIDGMPGGTRTPTVLTLEASALPVELRAYPRPQT